MLFFYILSCVQIVLESLPVSSSGHTMLVERLFEQQAAAQLIYLLHIPTLCILLCWYAPTLRARARYFWLRPQVVIQYLFYFFVADCITALCYGALSLPFFAGIKESVPLLACGFIVTVLLLLSLKRCRFGSKQSLDMTTALLLGAVQGVALFPGISRFGSVYVAACWLGLEPAYAFHITWLLQLPLIGAAVSKAVLFDGALSYIPLFMSPLSLLIIGGVSVMGYGALCMSYYLAVRRKFWLFGVYMIIPLLCTLSLLKCYICIS
jgi:undecaprenyl-diphosphatase